MTARPLAHDLTAIACPRCGYEHGRTNGREFVVGVEIGGRWVVITTILEPRFAMRCPVCQTRRTWYQAPPSAERLTVPEASC